MPRALKYLVPLGLLLALGAAGLVSGLLELPLALQLHPTELACADYVRDPALARWVELKGCRLQLAGRLGSPRHGLMGSRQGAQWTGVFLAVVPVAQADGDEARRVSVLLESANPRLLSFARDVDRLQEDELAGRLRQLTPVLFPTTVTAYVRPMSALEALQARDALGDQLTDDAVLLTEGDPQSAWSTLGLALALVAFTTLAVAATRRARAPQVDELGVSKVKVELGELERLKQEERAGRGDR